MKALFAIAAAASSANIAVHLTSPRPSVSVVRDR